MLRCSLLLLFVVLLVGAALSHKPITGSSYKALSVSLNCTGTTNITLVAPPVGTAAVIVPDTPSSFYVDTANQMYGFSIGIGGLQLVFANGTYEIVQGTCFYYPEYTFTTEKSAKSTAILKDKRWNGKDVYFGLVGDAGIGTTAAHMAITVQVDPDTQFPTIIDATGPAPLPRNATTGLCPPNVDQYKTVISLTSCTGDVPNRSMFQLPPGCWPENNPISWTAALCFTL